MTFTLHRGTRPIERLALGTPLSLGSNGSGCRHGPAGLRWLERAMQA
jgi:arginase family enzyme